MLISGRHLRSRAVLAAGLLALLHLAVLAPSAASAADRGSPRAPRDAYQKFDREDLAEAVRENGEVRVIVGLETPEEIARTAGRIPDQAQEQAVAARRLALLQRLAGHDVRRVSALRHHPFLALTVDAAGLDALLADPEVTSVGEDRRVYPVLHDTPGITRADRAWAAGYRGAGQVVAIVDSGVDKTHPFFAGKVLAEACFSQPAGSNSSYCPGGVSSMIGAGAGIACADFSLGCWHGTHVAGIAAGKYGVLSSTTGGIAPDANVIAIQVFQRECDTNGCGIVAYFSDLVRALDHVYALRQSYSIASVNLSLGGDVYTAPCDADFPSFKSVVDSLRSANIATVIAAGNAGNATGLSAPACVSNAVSVGSTDKQNAISGFSNSAAFLSLLAPGGAVLSSVPGNTYGSASGTSMATPHVAGAWAVLKSAKPNATVAEVLAALQSTGLAITDSRNGVTKSLIRVGNTETQNGALGVLLGQAPSYVLSGTVTAGGTGLAAVTLAAGSGTSCSTSNASGQYSCTVPSGWSGTLTPSLSGYTFTPGSRTFNNVTGNQSGQNFTAALQQGVPVLSAAPTSVAPGGNVTTVWSGIGSPSGTDWIGLYTPGAPNTAFRAWMYVSCSQTPAAARASGSCVFSIPPALAPGSYELRLLSNNGFSMIARSNSLTVAAGGGTTLSVSPASASAGSSVTATWSGIASPSAADWIGLYAPGTPNTAFRAWTYVSCSQTPTTARASGSCAFTIPAGLAAGSYELRLLANGGYNALANSNGFTVTGGGTVLSASPTSIGAGSNVTAAWSGIASPSATDWIGLFTPGAPNTAFVTWMYVSCSQTPGTARSSGSCGFTVPAGIASGGYELRLLANNGYTVLAKSQPVAVSAAIAPSPSALRSVR